MDKYDFYVDNIKVAEFFDASKTKDALLNIKGVYSENYYEYSLDLVCNSIMQFSENLNIDIRENTSRLKNFYLPQGLIKSLTFTGDNSIFIRSTLPNSIEKIDMSNQSDATYLTVDPNENGLTIEGNDGKQFIILSNFNKNIFFNLKGFVDVVELRFNDYNQLKLLESKWSSNFQEIEFLLLGSHDRGTIDLSNFPGVKGFTLPADSTMELNNVSSDVIITLSGDFYGKMDYSKMKCNT